MAARGVTEVMFYGSIASYWGTDSASFAPFDSLAAASDFDTEILIPMNTYRTLFQRNGRLTRLATFISPEEMTSDPLFVTNASLPDVTPQHMAIAHVMCGDNGDPCASPVRLRIEDGREVGFRPVSCMQYARDNLDQLPAAEVAYQRGPDGEGQVTLDNRAAIMTAVRAHNSSIDFPHTDSGCGCSVGGSPGILLLLFVGGIIALSLRRHRRSR